MIILSNTTNSADNDLICILFQPKLFRHCCNVDAMASFDARLIPEFSGENSKDSVAGWYSKARWPCKLNKVANITLVLPLRLTGYAYKIYDQLSEEEKLNEEKVKSALFKAFEADAFSA